MQGWVGGGGAGWVRSRDAGLGQGCRTVLVAGVAGLSPRQGCRAGRAMAVQGRPGGRGVGLDPRQGCRAGPGVAVQDWVGDAGCRAGRGAQGQGWAGWVWRGARGVGLQGWTGNTSAGLIRGWGYTADQGGGMKGWQVCWRGQDEKGWLRACRQRQEGGVLSMAQWENAPISCGVSGPGCDALTAPASAVVQHVPKVLWRW